MVRAAHDVLRSARYEDQHQLPLARLEILFALGTDGPAALTATTQATDRFDLPAGSPRYAWPVVTAGASAVLAAARQAVAAHDERLSDEAAAVADRLRTVAEKLEAFGPAQRAHQLSYAAACAEADYLLGAASAGGPGRPGGPAGSPPLAELTAQLTALLAAWDTAAAAWSDLGEPYPLAQSLRHAAQIALTLSDRNGAEQRLQRAARLAARLAAQPLSEQIAILARRGRIQLTRPDDAPAGPGPAADGPAAAGAGHGHGELGLTARELEVLRLVAAGRSNREIAAELFISPKTASVHVSNILGKLGAASRGEAAAQAHHLQLFDLAEPVDPG
jgi:DNA-binding CsgD family transcriptional regulator